jgi:hypothetical protein
MFTELTPRDRLQAGNPVNAVIVIAGYDDQIGAVNLAGSAHFFEPFLASAHVPGLIREIAAGHEDIRAFPLQGLYQAVGHVRVLAFDVDIRNVSDFSRHTIPPDGQT